MQQKTGKGARMSFSNFHTHCCFCDGEGKPEEYVEKAIEKGFEALGFSSHAPVHFARTWTMNEGRLHEYLDTVKSLKVKYRGRIQIYLGLEIDYFSKEYGPNSPVYRKLGLDYNIGSVHCMLNKDDGKYLEVDGTEDKYIEIIESIFKGDTEKFAAEYYNKVRNMVKEHKPDIIGHLDLIKKNNRGGKYFSMDQKWYRDEVFKTLDVISKSSCILEVNTGGLSRKITDTVYPEPWILKECSKLEIPLVLNSDAHNPVNIDAYYEDALHIIGEAGYSKLSVLNDGIWTQKSIYEFMGR